MKFMTLYCDEIRAVVRIKADNNAIGGVVGFWSIFLPVWIGLKDWWGCSLAMGSGVEIVGRVWGGIERWGIHVLGGVGFVAMFELIICKVMCSV